MALPTIVNAGGFGSVLASITPTIVIVLTPVTP